MRNVKTWGILFLCLLLLPGVAYAQKRQIEGTVISQEDKEPLIGATVIVKGSLSGAETDLDGHFTLEVDPDAKFIIVDYIGMKQTQVPIPKSGILNVALQPEAMNLDEVVVTGYGNFSRSSFTGSANTLRADLLKEMPVVSIEQKLQGMTSGVNITGSSGQPGANASIRIRGMGSFNASNEPLFVIDGVPVTSGNLSTGSGSEASYMNNAKTNIMSTINPSDIENITVIKDAAAASLYGSRAANGVILITTKKGTKSGQPRLTYDGYIGVQKTGKKYDVLNSMDRLNLDWEAQKNNIAMRDIGGYPSNPQFGTGDRPSIPNYLTQSGAQGSTTIDPSDYDYPTTTYAPFSDTDWWDELDRAAMIQNHQIGLSGGTEKGQYNLSANYFKQDGTVIDSYYQRYQVRANTSFNVRDWLRVGENLTYAFTKDNGLSANGAESNPYSWTYRASPWVPVYDIAGNFAGSKFSGTGNFQNPVANQVRNKDNYYTRNRIFGNLWAEADIFKDLTFRTNFGIDYTNRYYYRMEKKNPEFSESMGQNNFEEQSEFNYRWVWTNTLTYNKTFNDIHKLTVLLGTEAIRDGLGRKLTGRRYNYLFEDNTNSWVLNMGENNNQRLANSEYKGEFALFGLFGRVDYSFNDKYLFTGIIRRDGVSRFSKSNRYGVFPSASLGWRISQEDFMESTRDWLDDVKLRVGYGQTGNSEVPRITNYAMELATYPKRSDYDLNGQNNSTTTGFILDKYGNEDTKWESTEMWNVGVDATFLNGKFNIGAEWYWKKTTDMLIEAQYSAFANPEIKKPYINFADIKNTGVDLNLNYRDSKGDWSWDVSLNLSHYKNEVLRISESDDASLWGAGTRLDGNVTRTTKGHAISEFYGYKVNGFYENVDEVLALPPLGQSGLNAESAKAWVGKF